MKKLKDINWNQVYYFYEVARKMSMKEAAEVTGVSIPTVSEQIKRLETLLETPLFHRRPRRIELTTEGEVLFRYAKQMFEAGLRFLDVVSPTLIGGYPVRIGVQETFAGSVAFDFINRYFDIYSPFGTINTSREAIGERLIERVYNGELDWGITLAPPPSPRLEYAKVASTEVVFCVAPEMLDQYKTHADLFEYLPLARGRWDEQLNKLVSDHLQGADIYVEEVIESDHWEFCLELAEQGKCITLLAKGQGGELSHSNKLRTFTVGGPIVVSFYGIWRQASQRMIAIRKLIDLLDKESRAGRPRPTGPALPEGAAGEGPPIELPHHFEEERLESDFPE